MYIYYIIYNRCDFPWLKVGEKKVPVYEHSYINVSEVWNDYKRCFNKQYPCLKILYLQKWAYEKKINVS